MDTSYYFQGHQRVGLLREREKMIYWCMPLFLPYFLSLFYHFLSFFLSVLSLFLVSYYSPAVSCSPFWSFLFLGTSLWVLTTFLPCVFPLKCFPPLGLLLSMFFFLFPYFFLLLLVSPFSAMVTFLLQQTDSMGFLPFTPRYSPTIFGLLWASF